MPSASPASKKPRDQYHHGDLRNAILVTALGIVEDSGVEALTLRAVSQRLGVSHAAPVYHFRTRAQLLAALAEEGFRLLAEALSAAARLEGPQRLLRVVRAYLEFAQQHPNHYNVMFGPGSTALAASGEAPPAGFAEQSSRAFGVLVEISGDRGDAPLGERALAVWSLVHGLVMLYQGPLACRITPENLDGMLDLKDRVARQIVEALEASFQTVG